MKNFSELAVETKRSFIGTKKYIEDILNKSIVVEYYEIRPSKKPDGGECLYMQIKEDGIDHLIFSSSSYLMNVLKQLKSEDFPFTASIVKINRHYEFK